MTVCSTTALRKYLTQHSNLAQPSREKAVSTTRAHAEGETIINSGRYRRPLFKSSLGDLRRRNGTSPSVLRPDLLEKLKARLREPPPDGGLWTSPKVAAWMAGELGLAAVLPQRGWE